jgi:ATP-dependent Clp protease ATP-binding subunit ClpB
MDLEKFTDRARGFLQSAQTVAVRMNHQRITPGAPAEGAAGG